MKKRILCLLFSVLFIITSALPIFADNVVEKDVIQKVDIESFDSGDNIDEELKQMGFDLTDYKLDTTRNIVYLITLYEYCYSINKYTQDCFSVYLYIYSSNGQKYNTFYENRVNISVNESGFEQRVIRCLGYSDNGTVSKWKLPTDILPIPFGYSGTRTYDISNIILSTTADVTKALTVTCGSRYQIDGFLPFCNADCSDKSTIEQHFNNFYVLDLDLELCRYTTNSSEEGANWHKVLNSCYFSIPEHLQDLGTLSSVKASWKQFDLYPFMITTDNKFVDKYNNDRKDFSFLTFKNRWGFNSVEFYYNNYYTSIANELTFSGHYGFGSDLIHGGANSGWLCDDLGILWGAYGQFIVGLQDFKEAQHAYKDKLIDVFKRDEITFDGKCYVTYEELISDRFLSSEEYNDLYGNSYFHEKDYDTYCDDIFNSLMVNYEADEGYYFYEDILSDKTYTLASFMSNHNYWQRLFTFGANSGLDDTIEIYNSIVPVSKEDIINQANISSTLYMDDIYLGDFVDFASNALNNGEIPFLLRFSVTDKYSSPVYFKDIDLGTDTYFGYTNDCVLVKDTAISDFSIITLTFNKGGAITVIPVSATPVYTKTFVPTYTEIPAWFKFPEFDFGPILFILNIIIAAVIFFIVSWYVSKIVKLFRRSGGRFKPRRSLFGRRSRKRGSDFSQNNNSGHSQSSNLEDYKLIVSFKNRNSYKKKNSESKTNNGSDHKGKKQ